MCHKYKPPPPKRNILGKVIMIYINKLKNE